MDILEAAFSKIWPKRGGFWGPYLMLSPAILLVGLLVLGLAYIGDTSLRTLDTSTFLFSEEWSLANYERALTEPFIRSVIWRSILGATIVTMITLLLAFPYTYIMVRTRSAFLRKFLLIALFLPFFIGQVVRAYGWLIILGKQGIVNDILGLVGIEPLRMLFNYPSVLFGLVQYMFPFAVLMLAPALTAIPEEIEAAAESLGASPCRGHRHLAPRGHRDELSPSHVGRHGGPAAFNGGSDPGASAGLPRVVPRAHMGFVEFLGPSRLARAAGRDALRSAPAGQNGSRAVQERRPSLLLVLLQATMDWLPQRHSGLLGRVRRQVLHGE